MNLKLIAPSILVLGALFSPMLAPLFSQTQAATKGGLKPQSAAGSATDQNDDGQRIFEQNCSRCHSAPEGFSPRIAGTVVRHMRVRANLSREDEQKLLKFFNP